MKVGTSLWNFGKISPSSVSISFERVSQVNTSVGPVDQACLHSVSTDKEKRHRQCQMAMLNNYCGPQCCTALCSTVCFSLCMIGF